MTDSNNDGYYFMKQQTNIIQLLTSE